MLDLAQLSSFVSYRPFILPHAGFETWSEDAFEGVVRTTIAEGDEAFAHRRYQAALHDYLEAYGLLHTYLHPDFPSRVASVPGVVDEIDIFEPLVSTVVQAARFAPFPEPCPPPFASVDLPPAFWDAVGRYATGPRPPLQQAELAYLAATSCLKVGAVADAIRSLDVAERLNSRDDPVLGARLSAGRLVAEAMAGRLDDEAATRLVDTTREAYARLGMHQESAAVENNVGVLATLKGDPKSAGAAFQRAADRLPAPLGRTVQQNLNPGTAAVMIRPMGVEGLDLVLPGTDGTWTRVSPTVERRPAETLRVKVGQDLMPIPLAGDKHLIEALYQPRVKVADLSILALNLELFGNLVAYLPHVYGFVLPMSIGDTLVGLGRRQEAIGWYRKARGYAYLNTKLEAPKVWVQMARAIVEEGDHHFRKQDPVTARAWYERLLLTDGSVPTGGDLYQGPVFSAMANVVQSVVAAMNGGTPFAGNHEIAAIVAHVRAQLVKIEHGLNWLGLAADVVPIWTFDFLQGTARYFSGHAVQAWREYIAFRTTAEQAEMTERELEQAVTMNQSALDAQIAQQQLATDQLAVAEAVRDAAALHRNNLIASQNQFATDGWFIAQLNRLQAWGMTARDDIIQPSMHFDWGTGRSLDLPAGTFQEQLDALVLSRSWLSHQMQIENFARQITEAGSQHLIAERQVTVATAQKAVADIQRQAAEQWLGFSKDNLEFFRENEFTPDLWYQLAERLRQVANRYLEMGIYAAFLMERAYEVENGRDLRRIRFDYASPGIGELTAGDSLLADIDSFSHDLLSHVKGRRNRIRHVISLADFAPQAFMDFVRTGTMEFKVPLWVLERAYPGTYLHRIQGVEVEIEGLQVPEGITGTLRHLGISAWRAEDGTVHNQVTAPETMVLSGFRLRRDLTLYRADPVRLGLFENSGTAASWRLELPMSTNDVDFSSISDVRMVLYFHALHSPELEAQIRAGFPASDEAAQSFSARLHAPDHFFALGPPPDGSDTITFDLGPGIFPYNHTNLESVDLAVHVLRRAAGGAPEPFPNLSLEVTMAGQTAAGSTGTHGVVESGGGAGPLATLAGRPVGPVAVRLGGPPEDRTQVADLFLLLTYRFDYR